MTVNHTFKPFTLVTRGRLHTYSRPVVMGILNITPDSFYDGGRYNTPEAMLGRARQLLADGADIIDLGAASSRPGAELPPPEVEARRLREAVELLRAELPEAVISVDTCYSLPARAAVEAGADMVNDISGGLFDDRMFDTVAEMQVPYILMHNRALPSEMQQHTGYDDIVEELCRFFSQRLDRLYTLGVKDVWLDPGFGFAKSTDDNYRLLNRLDELASLFDEPLLAALSRKSMIYKPLGINPDEALEGTVALDMACLVGGARALRVHDPKPARQSAELYMNICNTL